MHIQSTQNLRLQNKLYFRLPTFWKTSFVCVVYFIFMYVRRHGNIYFQTSYFQKARFLPILFKNTHKMHSTPRCCRVKFTFALMAIDSRIIIQILLFENEPMAFRKNVSTCAAPMGSTKSLRSYFRQCDARIALERANSGILPSAFVYIHRCTFRICVYDSPEASYGGKNLRQQQQHLFAL